MTLIFVIRKKAATSNIRILTRKLFNTLQSICEHFYDYYVLYNIIQSICGHFYEFTDHFVIFIQHAPISYTSDYQHILKHLCSYGNTYCNTYIITSLLNSLSPSFTSQQVINHNLLSEFPINCIT